MLSNAFVPSALPSTHARAPFSSSFARVVNVSSLSSSSSSAFVVSVKSKKVLSDPFYFLRTHPSSVTSSLKHDDSSPTTSPLSTSTQLLLSQTSSLALSNNPSSKLANSSKTHLYKRLFIRLSCFLAITLVTTLLRVVNPAFATAVTTTTTTTTTLGPLARFSSIMESSSFLSGLAASFLLVLASEIGDKTFFISALLSMKYSRALVLIGTMVALASMTIISVGIGQVFHALPNSLNSSIPFDDYAAVALLLWFGLQNIRDGLAMKADDDDELQDAKEVVDNKKDHEKSKVGSSFRVVAETSSLIFLAEWGDKSMLATVALAAAKSPLGVIVGGISGHLIASIIAVVGGSVMGKFISERNARLIGGVLFFVFAFLTVLGIY